MFTDPMLGAKCVAVDKIVNDMWRTGTPDEVDPFRSPIVVIAGWGMGLARQLWSAFKSKQPHRMKIHPHPQKIHLSIDETTGS